VMILTRDNKKITNEFKHSRSYIKRSPYVSRNTCD